jgi:hypothetical protein
MKDAQRAKGPERAAEPAAPIASPIVGWIAGAGVDGSLLVDFEGNAHGPLSARSTVALDASAVLSALASRQAVVLLFEQGDPALPLIVGLVQPKAGTPLLELMLPEPPAQAESEAPRVATVDGERVTIEGRDEIVLRCGEASITLRRNGKVIIRGAYVETHAAGTNRIKGGSVRIN